MSWFFLHFNYCQPWQLKKNCHMRFDVHISKNVNSNCGRKKETKLSLRFISSSFPCFMHWNDSYGQKRTQVRRYTALRYIQEAISTGRRGRPGVLQSQFSWTSTNRLCWHCFLTRVKIGGGLEKDCWSRRSWRVWRRNRPILLLSMG